MDAGVSLVRILNVCDDAKANRTVLRGPVHRRSLGSRVFFRYDVAAARYRLGRFVVQN